LGLSVGILVILTQSRALVLVPELSVKRDETSGSFVKKLKTLDQSVIPACPESFFENDSGQAGMTFGRCG